MGKSAPHGKENMTEDKDQKIRKLITTPSTTTIQSGRRLAKPL
jgi:hypothetical protein